MSQIRHAKIKKYSLLIYFCCFVSLISLVIVLSSSLYFDTLSSFTQKPNTKGQVLQATSIPAFLGAEGFGANTPGGRGGRVIEITNLNDSGFGSLRACIETSGPRICVFRTGGTIELGSTLTITNPYITIAGQTAPGGGITLKGNGKIGIGVTIHDVVIRYLTIRIGSGGQTNAILIAKNGGDIYNVVVDHCSLSWATDEVLTT